MRDVVKLLPQPSKSGLSSPVVMARKSDGACRFCVDYRKPNKAAKKDAYSLTKMDIILDQLRAAKYVTTLDLMWGYHQIPMKENSKENAAFTVLGWGYLS